MRILVCPDAFKGCCSAARAAGAMAHGVRAAVPAAEVVLMPLADGGEGTVEALCAGTGTVRSARVRDPLMRTVAARWGLTADNIGVVEMAAASGLERLARMERNPLWTTSFGTGELIMAALDAGACRVVLGLGGSATTDGGVGMAQALGYRFLDEAERPFTPGIVGGDLARIRRIERDAADPRLKTVPFEAACDVGNPLCGPAGAAAVYGPQKGAGPAAVAVLERGLECLAAVMQRDLGFDVRAVSGAGAAGGLGAGALAFLAAQFRSGIDLVLDAVGFSDRLAGVDLVITGEGRIDRQSGMGKAVSGVLRRTGAAGVRTIAIAGSVEAGHGLDCDCFGITDDGVPVADAIARPERHLARVAERVIRGIAS